MVAVDDKVLHWVHTGHAVDVGGWSRLVNLMEVGASAGLSGGVQGDGWVNVVSSVIVVRAGVGGGGGGHWSSSSGLCGSTHFVLSISKLNY